MAKLKQSIDKKTKWTGALTSSWSALKELKTLDFKSNIFVIDKDEGGSWIIAVRPNSWRCGAQLSGVAAVGLVRLRLRFLRLRFLRFRSFEFAIFVISGQTQYPPPPLHATIKWLF